MSVIPDIVTVLVVQPDEQAHAPVQRALKAIARTLKVPVDLLTPD